VPAQGRHRGTAPTCPAQRESADPALSLPLPPIPAAPYHVPPPWEGGWLGMGGGQEGGGPRGTDPESGSQRGGNAAVALRIPAPVAPPPRQGR